MKKLVFIFISLLFLAACSQEQKVESENISSSTRETSQSSTPDLVSEKRAEIFPQKPTKDSTISLALNQLNSSTVNVEWLVNNEIVYGNDKMSFSYDRLKKGDTVQARVISEDMIEYYSNKLTVHNSPPVIVSAKFLPEKPKKDDTLTLKIESTDPDRDDVNYLYKWYVNNKYVSNGDKLEDNLKRGDTIAVHILASDGEDNSKITNNYETTIHNSSPIVSESLEDESFENNIYKVKINAHDPDGDSLTYSIKEDIENLTINQDGQIKWKTDSKDAGKHSFTVSVKDGHGGEVILPLNVAIEFQGKEQKENEHSEVER